MSTVHAEMTLAQLANWFRGIAVHARDYDKKELLEQVALPKLYEGVQANFDAAASPEGVPWAARAHDYPWPPLIKSRDMMESVTSAEAPGSFLMLDEGFVTIGSEVESQAGFPYPALHNRGGQRIPQREFLGLSSSHLDALDNAIADQLADTILEPA